jgi:hypothetical protein
MQVRKSAVLVFFPLLVAFLLTTATAQTNQGSIAGNVTDPSGALVSGAKITAKNVNTGATYETVSTSSGGYRLPNLSIGTYNVTIASEGFKSAVLTGVLVQTATTSALDIQLQTGTITENVTVSADVPTVQTESSDIGTVVSTKQILDLPLALGSVVQPMRSPEAFVFLTPGAVGPGSDSGSGGTFESKISGGQNYATEVLLDGAATTRSENGSSFDETAPSVEALGEFKVLTSTLPSEVGRTTGGIESFNTKAGTNNYHGNVYDIFRNEDLNANLWGKNYLLAQPGLTATQRRTFQRDLDRQNDYGGTLGGPVVIPRLYDGKNKTFFFFSWEQYRRTQGGTTTSTVPTDAERNGDFSATLNTGNVLGTNPCDGTPIYEGEIFDPATTQIVGGVQCRTAFPGNIIPSTRFSSVGQNLLSFYPAPQNGNLLNNYVLSFSFPVLNTTTTFRIDQNITSADKAYFTYSSRENTRLSTNPAFDNPAGWGRTQFFGTHFMRLGYDHTFGPSVLNHLNIGYNRTNSKNVGAGIARGNGKDWDQVLGITGGPSGPLFPSVNPGEPSVSTLGDDVDGDTIDNGFRFNDSLTWIKGKHQFKFGYEQWYSQYSPLNFGVTSGRFNFGRAETAGTPTANLSGNGVASLLLGAIDNSSYFAYANQPRWVRNYYAGFVQDSFKVMPTLTLNLGFRYEIDQPFKEASDNYANVSLTAPNPSYGNRPGAWVFAGKGAGRNGVEGERWAETYKKNFGPRFGFAWSPAFLGAGKTAIRGGYGIIYGGLQYADFGAFGRTGFQAQPGFGSPDGFNPAFALDSGVPAANITLPNLDPSQVNFNPGCCTADYIAKSYGRPPMIQNWSFEVQRELATDLILDLAYVGQHSTHLRTNYDGTNSLYPSYFSLGSNLQTPVANPFFNPTDPLSGPPTFIKAQSLAPFPQFFGLNSDGQLENLGQSSYNALEAQLTRRFHNGLNLLASYTWSKTLTNADAALPFFATLHQGGAGQFPYDPRRDVSLSNQDLPHNFVAAYIYELPFGKGKRFVSGGGVSDRVLGGWSVSGVHRYESGQPIALACATGVPAYTGCIRFDRVAGQPLYSQAWASGKHDVVDPNSLSVGPVFNAAAFSDPNLNLPANTPYRFGTFDKVSGAMRMTPYLSEDFNILKRTRFTESRDLLLQVTFANAFNRHVWNRPGPLNPNFGDFSTISIANGGSYLLGPRVIQLQLKFEY